MVLRSVSIVLSSAAALSTLVTTFAGGASPGDGTTRVPDFTFVDARFLRRTLADFGERRAYVLYFTTCDCPLARRYLPRLKELEQRFRERGVQFVAVNVGLGETVVEAQTQALDHDVPFPFVKDPELEVAHAVGATCAGEVVVLDARRDLCYRGRVDDQYRLGGEREAAGSSELADALEDLLAGREVRVAATPAEGCRISAPPAPRLDVTFEKDVAPLIERHCVECHRRGGEAPFELRDFVDAVDHAAMIREVVELGRMPPWHASPAYGRFANRRSLGAEERRTLIDWVALGSPRGEVAPAQSVEAPADSEPARAPDGIAWKIGAPDLVLRAPTEMHLPADGIVPYQYTVLPYVFSDDTWVHAVQIVPRNPRVMHHCNLAWVRLGEPFRTENFITGQVPGGDPMVLEPGTAVLVPKGALLGLQIHYVTSGREESDQITVGLVFPRETVQKRLRLLELADLHFAIPPGAPAHPVRASRAFDCNAIGVGMYAHMHKRGRDMRFVAHAPDGKDETLLLIPTYDFDWQASYRWFPGQQRFARGTRVDCLAHFDNSSFNPWNPDPGATVRFGLQTTEEMMYGFLFYLDADEHLGLQIDPSSGRVAAR